MAVGVSRSEKRWCHWVLPSYIYAPGPATPPSPPWDRSHILPPYEIFPLPPSGVVGVWNCPLPPLWCGGGVVLFFPSCGVVGVWSCPPPPCGVVGAWYCHPPRRGVVGVWYGMLGMYGVYGRSGMACLESMICWVCMVGMLCMA